MGNVHTTRAVVLGGSIAGLFAARVLTEAYDEVVIVDRDTLVGVSEPRRGCPQSRHINGLLARGQQVMEGLFPGITEELFADGVPTGDLAGDVRWIFNGKALVQQGAGLVCVSASRPKLEFHIRGRVQALRGVTFAERRTVQGLVTTPENDRVTGVRVHNTDEDAEETITADLVVDATGRGSRTPVWLEEMGYGRVVEERKKVGLGYVSQHYKLTTDPYHGDLSINPVASPELPRGAIFTKTDGDRVELTTYGILGDHPPTDQKGLVDWLGTLAVPDIQAAVRTAEVLDEPVAFHYPTTLRRHYEDLDRFPAGLLVTGDAVTSFNPVYAQGMTVSALSSLVLRQHLHSNGDPDPLSYFQDLATTVIDPPWQMTNMVDLSFPGVQGERTAEVRIGQFFLKLVQTAATRDGKVTAAYMRAAGLIDRPESLKRPALVARVLWNVARIGLSALLSRKPATPVPAPAAAPAAPARPSTQDATAKQAAPRKNNRNTGRRAA